MFIISFIAGTLQILPQTFIVLITVNESTLYYLLDVHIYFHAIQTRLIPHVRLLFR